MKESIQVGRTDYDLEGLVQLLRKVDAQVFRDEGKSICDFNVGLEGHDVGHNVIVIDHAAAAPPVLELREYPRSLTEQEIALHLMKVEDEHGWTLRCYGNVIVKDEEKVVAIFDPMPEQKAETPSVIFRGRMSTFGGWGDSGMTMTENLAWIERESQAAAYPGYFNPQQGAEGFGWRLKKDDVPYVACRWDYRVLPKTFLSQPGTWATITNPATGQTIQARPIDWGPHQAKTGRDADVSPFVAAKLGLKTDDVVEVRILTPSGLFSQPPPPLVPERRVAHGARSAAFLTGDYATSRRLRQRQAKREGCALAVDFHFNSNGSSAIGGEVYYKDGDERSRRLAMAMVDAFHALGLPDHGDPVKPAGSSRAAFILAYECPAVLVEPLFISNPRQAAWIREAANLEKLAAEVANAIKRCSADGDTIGLSVGHFGKDSAPQDRGARHAIAGWEAEYAQRLADGVALRLSS